jgi:phospholipid/cholesterol/gamma-HCH transport system ATP-binding protein
MRGAVFKVIHFQEVYKNFGSKKVLQGLNLEIGKGEVFFILGGSGTGKSVALKSLVGLHQIDKGRIEYDGRDISRLSEEEFTQLRKEISMVFQLPALLDSRSLLENLNLPIRRLPSAERWTRIKNALEATCLSVYRNDLDRVFPTSLSYGEQKRMAIARSLVIQPKVLLYDEPTTGMDAETAKEIHELIRSVATRYETTSVVVSHDISNALNTADRIAVMNEGTTIFNGNPSDLRKNNHPIVNDFLISSHQRSRESTSR